MSRRTPLHTALRCAIAASALGLACAHAQDVPATTTEDTTTLDRIEVTGSRIRRVDTETASPVQTIQREDIDRTGKATLGEFLQTLAVDGSGSVPKSFGAGFASGASGVSLRGLGAGSTLVLVNGRRIAPYGMADDGQKVFTDLSIIPMEAVERVDILKDGASSIYGSDAIAGVVNVILRKDFDGLVARASYGQSGDSDGDERKLSATWGLGSLADDGFNFFFSAEVGKSDEIFVRDRADRDWIGTGDLTAWGYDPTSFGGLAGYIPDGGISQNTPVGAIEYGPGDWRSLEGPEACAQLSTHSVAQDPNPNPLNRGCIWDVVQFTSLQPEQQYANFFARAAFALSESATLYHEFALGQKESAFTNTPSGVSGAWASPLGGAVNASSGPGATVLGADHPDNPLGTDARLRYSAFDVGPRRTVTDNRFFRFLVGVEGAMGEWDYDVAYLHSSTDLDQSRTGFLHYGRVREVLADGDSSPVGWWRLGTGAAANSQALYDYISPTIGARAETQLDSLELAFTRSLFDLSGGPLGLALGAEWRRLSARLTPVTFTDESNVIGLGYSAYDGDETVASAYVELSAPVLETLEVSGALRVDSYRDGETSVTPKVGAKWTPARWIALRGTYAEGFRAPNPAETAGSSVGFATVNDPVRCSIEPTPSNCPSAVAFMNQPNPDLEPEESTSYTVGLVLQPTDRTTVALDAWRIERENEITTMSLSQAMADPANVIRSDDDVPGFPGSGTLLAVLTNYINASSTLVQGVDLDARHVFPFDSGRLSLDLQWSHIDKYEIDDGDRYEIAGTHDNCNVTNCIGTPKDRANFGATWTTEVWSLSSVVNYRGAFDNTVPYSSGSGDECAAVFADGTEAPEGCEIPSFHSIDLSGTWQLTDALQLFGSVQNVTDRVAPLDPTTYGALNFNPLDFSGAMGRFYTLGLRIEL
ncbi:TonB-dependent receptor [Luteimonas sp. SDU82]|uniref:TonB-dependent receptor n=1 Tax=Luteimonas sp. SDU82 TaxID=3422592 RepID=UPI003EBA3662